MIGSKTDGWTPRAGRKLRVVFVEDGFWGYVDLPDAPGAQRAFEDELRRTSGGSVSLYRPGSAYRDAVTPPLTVENLHVVGGDHRARATVHDRTTTDQSEPPSSAVSRPSMIVTVPHPRNPARSPGTRGTFAEWWSALLAVPGDRDAVDFWATPDGRASRYQRLRRVWADTTRNGWFYDVGQEDHLTATLWENLCLFHPAGFLPALLSRARLASSSPASPLQAVQDCCWSYEFEEAVRGKLKQVDVTIHYRDAAGDGLLVVEAKRPGGALKPTDADPSYYLDLPSFAFTRRRSMLYLVDERDVTAAAQTIRGGGGGGGGPDRPYGIQTWQQLGGLQVEQALALAIPDRLRVLCAGLIRWQFERHGLSTSVDVPDYPRADAPIGALLIANQRLLSLTELPEHRRVEPGRLPQVVAEHLLTARQLPDCPNHVRDFIAGGIQHQSCTLGVRPAVHAFEYLATEPPRSAIVPGMAGRQRTRERRAALWRLPPRKSGGPEPAATGDNADRPN